MVPVETPQGFELRQALEATQYSSELPFDSSLIKFTPHTKSQLDIVDMIFNQDPNTFILSQVKFFPLASFCNWTLSLSLGSSFSELKPSYKFRGRGALALHTTHPSLI